MVLQGVDRLNTTPISQNRKFGVFSDTFHNLPEMTQIAHPFIHPFIHQAKIITQICILQLKVGRVTFT